MFVKKVNPEWQPSENPALQVGEVTEITDPRQLVLDGDVVVVDENGSEVSAYELYGVITPNEWDEYKAFREMKNAETEQERLQKEKERLEAELAKVKTTTKEVKEDEGPVEVSKIEWNDLVKMANQTGKYKVGLKRAEVEKIVEEGLANGTIQAS